MEQLTEIIIQLIGNEVCGNRLELPVQLPLGERLMTDLFIKSKEHDVVHLVASALSKNKLMTDGYSSRMFTSRLYTAVLKSEKMEYAFDCVCDVLEKNKIPYIPLKGAVLRELYPEKWMRSSVDIDILVHESDLQTAADEIAKDLGYTRTCASSHDISFQTDENIFIELHFRLIEDEHKIAATDLLEKVWDYASPCEQDSFRYKLEDSFFFLYHVAHMAKHVIHGGCGIRPFLDLWLMNRNHDYSDEQTRRLLKEGSMLEFAKCAEQLSMVWFSGAEHTPTTLSLQNFVMKGGIFGTKETRMLSDQQRNGGRRKHIFKRIFVPYRDLAYVYPIIKKYPFLTPFCEICRLFSLVFGKKKRFRKAYLTGLNNVSQEYIDEIRNLFERVEL